nr:hypothetical protein [Streptomyces sp. 846.5]
MDEQKRDPQLNDDRLCWLAVRDQLGKKSRRLGVFGWITVLRRPRGTHRRSARRVRTA